MTEIKTTGSSNKIRSGLINMREEEICFKNSRFFKLQKTYTNFYWHKNKKYIKIVEKKSKHAGKMLVSTF